MDTCSFKKQRRRGVPPATKLVVKDRRFALSSLHQENVRIGPKSFHLSFLPFMNNTKRIRINRQYFVRFETKHDVRLPIQKELRQQTTIDKYFSQPSNYNLSEDEKPKPQVTHFLEMKTFQYSSFFFSFLQKTKIPYEEMSCH